MSKIEIGIVISVVVIIFLAGSVRLRTRRRRLKFNLEVDTSSFTETVERMSQDMQRQIEERIGELSTEDIVRAMMGRRMVEQLDEELMTGVEGTTETIPPGAISSTEMPLTTSHTRDLTQERERADLVERDATRLVATHGMPWREAMEQAEANFTVEEVPPGPLPFIDPATGQYTDRDPALDLPDPAGYERERAASPGERQSAPLLEWMLDSCRLCSQFVMTNTTIDDSEQAMLCGEGATEPCNVFGMWLAEPDTSEDVPPIVYIWMTRACPAECHTYDPTHDLHEHALACIDCYLYAAWHHRGGARQIPQGHELVEPALDAAATGEVQDSLAPSDVQTDARVEVVGARCPWMDPAFCDGCRSRVPRLCPQDQAVRCAGEAEPPGQGHRCNILHGWALGHPGHPHLALVRSASACDRGDLVRVIRFKK